MDDIGTQQKLLEVAQALQRSAVAVAHDYSARQAALGLERVLTEDRLASLDGIAQSLATLDALAALDQQQGADWERWMLAATRRFTAVLEAVPAARRAAHAAPLMATLQREMDAQHASRAARADWLDAARRVCMLARRGREVDPDTPGIVLADDEDIAEFERQLARVDAAVALQQAQFEERAVRIQVGMGRMQLC